MVRSEEEGTSQPDSSREAKRRRDQADPDMASKADVIVTEIFDSALLGEGLLPSMRHSAKHLLKVRHSRLLSNATSITFAASVPVEA